MVGHDEPMGVNESATSAHRLADDLIEFVVAQLEGLERASAPGLVLPRTFAGHVVREDARSDLAFTLGLLHEAGVHEVARLPTGATALGGLRTLDGGATNTFYSYRAAETVARLGGFADNPALAGWSEEELAELALAFDSTDTADVVRRGEAPPNFAVVLARCEEARRRLGLLDDTTVFDEFTDRTRTMLSTPTGWVDDSFDASGQYDIYTPDVYLFAEPLAPALGDAWPDGLRRVLADVGDLALPGGAVVWGRSTGALGLAMTIELAGVGVGRGLVDDADTWLARARHTLATMEGWFTDGVIRAHQYRSTMFYRGPGRRLQMTLDVLGKLVQAALEFRSGTDVASDVRGIGLWPGVDRFVEFGTDGTVGAWVHRDPRLSFVMPVVSGWSPDYAPAPRAPGVLEVPVGGLASLVPTVHAGGEARYPVGPPSVLEHVDNGLELRHDRYNGDTDIERTATYRVEGRTLTVDEHLRLGQEVEADAIELLVPEVADRPLGVTFEVEGQPVSGRRIDVAGIKEWRSFWNEQSVVHQLDLEPAPEVRFRWSVTPRLRVGCTALGHDYQRALYDPLVGRVVEVEVGRSQDDIEALSDIDVVHVDWPEWFTGDDPDRARTVLGNFRDAGVRVVWTMHNLLPHYFKHAHEVYEVYAEAADGVIHHSNWGREVALGTYDYSPDSEHIVAPHGHWGDRFDRVVGATRSEVEASLGLEPCEVRLAIVGAPRAEKDTQLVIDAFIAADRADMQLVIAQRGDAVIPDDPRVIDLTAGAVPEGEYQRRFAALDAIVLPFERDGMLTTGAIGDVIGSGTPAITSDWGYLTEALGEAAVSYGSSPEDLTALLRDLTGERLAEARTRTEALRPLFDWDPIAEQTLQLLEEVAARPW